MDAETKEFLVLCDATIAETEQVLGAIQRGELHRDLHYVANILLENLHVLRQHIVEGTLRRPSQGIGFGMIRAVGEWAEGLPLMDAVRKLERFYKERM